jgi:Tripartite tricarboxylate transporter family receptor
LIVFVPAGATPDIIARLIGQSLSQRFGQSVVIDNRPGAGGNLALQAVARAPADGYTLLMVATLHAINVTLYEKSPISVTHDIVPVASINSDAFVLLVNPSFPAKTVAEFIAHAKANPGKINLASNGTGNLTHLSGAPDDDRHRAGARALSRYAGRRPQSGIVRSIARPRRRGDRVSEARHWRCIADQQIRGNWSPVSMSTIRLPPKMVRDSARLRIFVSWLDGFKNPRVAREVSENVIIDSIARFEARPGPHYTA